MANKLYEENSVKAIASALRLKRNGISDTYFISGMADAALNLPLGNIPKYHREEAGRVVKKILDLKALYPNNIVFGTISDNHVDKGNVNAMTSARHAVYALEVVGGMACDFVANLGDNVAGTNIDNDTEYDNAVYMENVSRYAMTNLAAYNLVGNHCKSDSTQKIYNLIGKYNSFDDYGTTQIRGFGYKDYTNKKVRVICLNTCDYWNGQGGNGMSYEQKDFFMKALDLSDKGDYAEWTIVVLSHIPLDFLGGDYNKGADLKAILNAYHAGTTVSITVDSNYANSQNESSKYSGALTYNYSGKNAPKVINIHGHVHTNCYGKLKYIDDNTELDMVRMATPNSSFNGNASTDRYTAYGDYSITATEAAKIKKVANSKADTSATFYFIDLEGQTIYSIGYGADIDRTLTYSDKPTYTVTYNLTNCTSSNTVTRVIDGNEYSTYIMLSDDATLGNIVVTMGSEDITKSVYNSSNNQISIPQVCGDIVITAVANIPLWTETVSDIAVAIRSYWKMANGVPSLEASNTEASIGVTTANDYAYVDRESKDVYLMPVNTKASDVTVNNSDGTTCTYRFIGLKSNGDGTLNTMFDTGKMDTNTYAWTAASIDYMLISMERIDGTSYPWGYDDSQVSVVFTNGGTESGGDSGDNGETGGDTASYKNWVKYSTESDGETIYNNGLGYKDGYRIRSGGAEAEKYDATITGYIPFTKADKLYIYPQFVSRNTENAINFFNSSFENIGQITDGEAGYGICANDSVRLMFLPQKVDGVSVLDISNVTVSGVENIAYVRITNLINGAEALMSSGAEMIITKNEEMSNGSTTTYTNIIDTVGTEDNVRLRSSGATAEGDGFVSNYFAVKAEDIIRVKFPNGSRTGIPSNGAYCFLYSDTNGTVVTSYDGSATSVVKNMTDTGYEIHIPADKVCSYARVAGGPAGAYDGWIVTVNEEIN